MSAVSSVLLHVCCAPDGTVPWPALAEEGMRVTGFFYGSNIHPFEEWVRRRDAVYKLAETLGAGVEVAAYEPDVWTAQTQAMCREPEGGARCALCFALQLDACASYAARNGFEYLCTTLSISPHKDPHLLNEIGARVAAERGVLWLSRVWRRGGGFQKSVIRSKEWGLYRQNYCGCRYSVREGANAQEVLV